jgi:FHA domain-containing protein
MDRQPSKGRPKPNVPAATPMTLTLLAVSLNDQPLSQPITAHFDSRGGTIGRADHNTMALPDPERHVSRLQAEIVAARQGFLIRNVGAANPIMVAGRAVARGESAPLAHLDEVRIGGYLLQVDCRTQEAALDITRGRAMLSTGGFGLTPLETPASAMPPAPLAPPPLPVAPRPAAQAPAMVSPPPPAGGGNPFADLLGPAAASPAMAATPAFGATSDPFADLLGPGPSLVTPAPARPAPPPGDDPFAGLMPPPAGLHASSPALATPAAAPARLPDDFDPFAVPPPASLAERAAQAPAPDPFADLGSGAAPASIDQLFGLGAAAGADPLANFMAAASPPPASPAGGARLGGAEAVSTDPMLALFGDNATPATAPPAQADHLPALNAAYAPPRVVAPTPAPAPSMSPAPVAAATFDFSQPPQSAVPAAPDFVATAPDTGPLPLPLPLPLAADAGIDVDLDLPAPRAVDGDDAQRLWAALCAGAGIQLPLPPAEAEQRLREVGQLLRSAVDGTLRLMAVRASTKHELRAAVTVIQARGNNPLKFSPDAKAGLEYLLQPSVRGFLAGPAAMDDAMHDLLGHSIGTVAGMRAAIDGMLDRFAPDALEAKLVGGSVLDSVLPSHRKARLWDLYLQHHQAIREEAHEDFQTLFGKAFLAAYDQQIDKLKREENKPR